MKPEEQHVARARGSNFSLSRKFSVEVAGFVRGKDLVTAKRLLQGVIDLKVAVPFKRYHMDLGHKRGSVGPGKYPEKVAREFLQLLHSAEMNAVNKGLSADSLYLIDVIVNKGNSQMKPGRLRGRHAKRTHLEIVLAEREKKKEEKTRAKKDKKSPQEKKSS